MSSLWLRPIQENAQAMVEFALTISALVLILMGVFDLGQGVYAYNVVSSAAREGARYGITDPTNSSAISDQAKANAVGLNPARITVTSSCSPCTATNPISVTVTYNWQPLTLFFTSLTFSSQSTMVIE